MFPRISITKEKMWDPIISFVRAKNSREIFPRSVRNATRKLRRLTKEVAQRLQKLTITGNSIQESLFSFLTSGVSSWWVQTWRRTLRSSPPHPTWAPARESPASGTEVALWPPAKLDPFAYEKKIVYNDCFMRKIIVYLAVEYGNSLVIPRP